jgi:sortase A
VRFSAGRTGSGYKHAKLSRMGWLRKLEHLLLIVGALMLAFYVAARLDQATLSDAELHGFKSRRVVSAAEPRQVAPNAANPDFSLWSERRIRDYQESLAAHFAPAIAILRISKIQLEVPVLEGTDDLSLNRGVGHVVSTDDSGRNDNMAIAGHRDGFFRGLKDVGLGDMIEIDTPERTDTYVIDRITIVDPNDVSVLQARPFKSLTLITCYPFYFVGSAPKRFIVQASIADSAANAVGQAQSKPAVFRQQENARETIANR